MSRRATRVTWRLPGHLARSAIFCVFLAFIGVGNLAHADTTRNRIARFLSREGFWAYVAVGTLLPFAEDHGEGGRHVARNIDSMLATGLLTEGLKLVVREPRPDHSDREGFPSGHAAVAFSLAEMASSFHRDQAPFWYAGAGLIGYSRVELGRHQVHDVIGGAALGYGVSRWEISEPRGLILTPFITPDRRGAGLRLAGRF